MKRRRASFKRKRFRRVLLRKNDIEIKREIAQKKEIVKISPSNFSIIDNTNEVINYINECRSLLHQKEKIIIDIESVENLTPDAIALLAACANDEKFRGKYGQILGNAPKLPHLKKLFLESGFYNYVNSSSILKYAQNPESSLLHRESDYKVQPELARQACIYGINHVFGRNNQIQELYEIIIEAMSNTNNHASEEKGVGIKWWLSAYNNPNGNTCYTFVDLGVGIFDSIPVKLFKRTAIKFKISHNISLVQDLLDGKIKSREAKDNAIRGKGIPQIAQNCQKEIFSRAYIISNDVKINLKTKKSEKVSSSFKGTLIYLELNRPQNYESIKD